LIDGVSYVADVTDRDGACVVEVGGEWYEITVEEQTRHIIRTRAAPRAGRGAGRSPRRFRVRSAASRCGRGRRRGRRHAGRDRGHEDGERVQGDGPGTVAEVRVEAGQTVNAGDVLIVMA